MAMQKFNERKSMAAKGDYRNEEDKAKWSAVIKLEAMSSDESDTEDGEEVIDIHPLPWLSAEVIGFKSKLDEEIKKEKTPQARRQTKKRVIGVPSSRQRPSDKHFPSWAMK